MLEKLPVLLPSLSLEAAQIARGHVTGLLLRRAPLCHQAGASSLGPAQVGGRKCLLNECVRWWSKAWRCLPGGISKSQVACPLHSLFLGPGSARLGRGGAVSVLGP